MLPGAFDLGFGTNQVSYNHLKQQDGDVDGDVNDDDHLPWKPVNGGEERDGAARRVGCQAPCDPGQQVCILIFLPWQVMRNGGDKVDQEESVADGFRNRHRRQSFKFDEKQASGRKTDPTFFIVFLQTFPLSVETDRAWRRRRGGGCGCGWEENEHF